jgi:hypothetical protein
VEYIGKSAHMQPVCCGWARPQSVAATPHRGSGRRLIDSALRLRAYALLSNTRLYVRLIFPESRLVLRKIGR